MSRHLYGNIWAPLPFSSLVWMTDTSAFRQTASQTKLFLQVGHYPRAALGFCENVIQVSCPLVIFRNSFSQLLHLKMTFWHHLHGNHFASSSVMVACLQTGPLWGQNYEWILNNTNRKKARETERVKERERRIEFRGGDKDKVRVSGTKRLRESLMPESPISPKHTVTISYILILFCKMLTVKCYYLVCTSSHT